MRTASHLHRLPILAAAMIALPVIASAQQACTTYTVKDGDTLGSIAQAAYGTFDYQMIFNANRDALAANPNNLPAGMQLILPCEDGRLSADQELSSVIAAETRKQEASARKSNVYEPPLKFVTSNNWAPFTDESLTGGGIYYGALCAGIAAEVVDRAFRRGDFSEGTLSSYQRGWQEVLGAELRVGYLFQRIYRNLDNKQVDFLHSLAARCGIADFVRGAEPRYFDYHSRAAFGAAKHFARSLLLGLVGMGR